jgi:hypothetical protein
MSNLIARLEACRAQETFDHALLDEVAKELDELRRRNDALEELLIMIVRTGWPWDPDGEPNEMHRCSRDGYATAMVEARQLLGLDHLSRITRTEPRT